MEKPPAVLLPSDLNCIHSFLDLAVKAMGVSRVTHVSNVVRLYGDSAIHGGGLG